MINEPENNSREPYYAHSSNSIGHCHLLKKHLHQVSEMAAKFAEPFGAAEEAKLAGMLHDLGKYGNRFQRRLKGLERGIDHWSSGAWVAWEPHRALAALLAIQGHHIGLLRLDKDELRRWKPTALATHHPLNIRLSDDANTDLLGRFTNDGLIITIPSDTICSLTIEQTASAMLDIRMLFSTLADADFLDTEEHFQAGRQIRPVAPDLAPSRAFSALLNHLKQLSVKSDSTLGINQIRNELLASCIAAGPAPRGILTLTAPTGAGKTLAMLAFALRHAIEHKLRRIVIVIPYLSIIEQTANTYRTVLQSVFGNHYLLEHHSLAGTQTKDLDSQDHDAENDRHRQARLLAENWDAPLIITTSVQMLESLFANRPGACRKLHRLAGSVILFDEVQTLPPALAVPTLATLAHLASPRYGSTVVFSTATQPAFSHLDDTVRQLGNEGWQPREIVTASLDFFARIHKIRKQYVQWPDLDRPVCWEEITDDFTTREQVLCIVNIKRHAFELASLMHEKNMEGVFHLSTAMCPAHRRALLRLIRCRLRAGLPCRLIATQCVEAGVDVDFPSVYRALGPLDSIAQAAGRCNRNGLYDKGEVRVFLPEDEIYPPGGYEQAAEITRILIREHGDAGPDIEDPNTFTSYYQRLYDLIRPQ